MEHLTIKTNISEQQYINLMYTLSYKRPTFILLTCAGIFMLILSLLYFMGINKTIDSPPYQAMIFSFCFLVVIPLAVLWFSKQNYRTNKIANETISYIFNSEKIFFEGESFKSEISWSSIHDVKEVKNWILIFQNKTVANIISKDSFTKEQLERYKFLVNNISHIKTKLKV